jgi:tetratricopeptide (TPR) repeat protein
MPFTLNGVGTRYVGKQNLLVRSGACGQCGRAVQLESYDTREWFVLAFVPLIPLTRYHILDKCPRCTRHQRLVAAVWQAHQAEARLSAQSLLRQRPGDARTAIEAHQRLASFQLAQDAAELEAALARQFGDDAEVLVYLGQLAAAAGRDADALRHWELAHKLDPAQPFAREGLALAAVQAGQPDRALELLGPVLESQTLQRPSAGCALASALVGAGRFEDAHRVQRALLERFPLLGNAKSFARELRKTEKALGAPRTLLTATRLARQKWIAAAVVGALALCGVVLADVHAGRHVKLYVVDSLPGRLQVEIPGTDPVSFRVPGVHELELPAGTYHARVSGALQREVEFKLERRGWPRFLDDSIHVLDASGNSLLLVEQTTYSVRGDGRDCGRHVLFGEDCRRLDGIDYPFEEFPQRLTLSSREERVQKSRVELLNVPLENVVYGLLSEKDARTALALATWGLGREPRSPERLECYLDAVRAAHAEKQAAALLAPRLEARPVDLAVHQAWIGLASDAAGEAQARARYRELAEREPAERAWPYLCACLSPRVSERRELLERALGDEAPAEMWRELAATQACDGEWALALESARRALAQAEGYERESLGLRFDALGALGRGEDLQRELAPLFEQFPGDPWLAMRHFELLPSGTGDADVVRQLTEWQLRARKDPAQLDASWVLHVHAWCAFVQGDVAALERIDAGNKDHSLRWLLASALADKGRLVEAHQYLEGKLRCEIEPYDALALALACRAGGDEAQAAAWEQRGLAQLTSGVDAEARRLLSGERRGVADEALDLALRPWRKAVVLALLSFSDEPARVRLLRQALALQARPIFPRRIVEELASKAAPR